MLQPPGIAFDATSGSRRASRPSSPGRTAYVVENEQLPEDDFNRGPLQPSLDRTRRLAKALACALGSGAVHTEPGSHISRLYAKARDYADFRCPSTRTVGFVGQSGVGKSSLLNSLLDRKNFLRTGNSGMACTCAIVEFHYREANDFLLDVVHFDTNEMKGRLSELLGFYRAHHLEPAEGRTQDPGVLDNIATRASLAEHTFKAMFSSPRLEELLSGSEASALATLLHWQEMSTPTIIDGLVAYSTQEQCSHALLRLSSEQWPSDEDGGLVKSPWPVYMKAHILSKGLVLVDLPGLNDLNSARRNVTERYLVDRECDDIFAVCRIGRATTDECVKQVFELGRRAGLPSIGIICTCSDDIRENEAARDSPRPRGSRIANLAKDRDNASAEVKDLYRDLGLDDDSTDDEDCSPERKEDMWRRLRRARRTLDERQFELSDLMINGRNDDVLRQLRNEDNLVSPNRAVLAFCISNTIWWKHRNDLDGQSSRWLELSGIPRLRQYCIGLVSRNQISIAMSFIELDVSTLLSDVGSWVLTGAGNLTGEQRLRLREILDEFETNLRTSGSPKNVLGRAAQVSQIIDRFNRACRETVLDCQHSEVWSAAATDKVRDWSGFAWNTFAAFCRRHGEFRRPGGEPLSWNQEAMSAMVQDLANPTKSLDSVITNHEKRLLDSIENAVGIHALGNDLRIPSEAMEALLTLLPARQHLMRISIASSMENFYTSYKWALATLESLRVATESNILLRILKHDLTQPSRTAFFGQALEPTYQACQQDGGSGLRNRNINRISAAMGDPGVYEGMIRRFLAGFDLQTVTLEQCMRKELTQHVNALERSLDILRTEHAAQESERDPALRGRVHEALTKAVEELAEAKARVQHLSQRSG
ncbi:hypothetical protein M409DRAFT_20780 [Zasmidium cellare ATCC 36951]|uniref:G domain-containing protein n=1 Tax=Zasmidium cellare ATCC 36951 TaxID=1080233 RepID=A0A6A6CQ09_ZASCE|nr:uncharacterized protein M409DRAFT_20780 [Zasmidium cellare ATCC 36951]KAF2168763.1 hypothetical protein M409DRAFT_20780 [Zasmidium cellare ATCC 36951]